MDWKTSDKKTQSLRLSSSCPFEKATITARVMEIADEHGVRCTIPNILNAYVYSNIILRYVLCIISIFAVPVHTGICYSLLFAFEGTVFNLLILFLVAALFFMVLNGLISWDLAKNGVNNNNLGLLIIYLVPFTAYVGISCATFYSIFDYDIRYFTASLVFFILGINVYGFVCLLVLLYFVVVIPVAAVLSLPFQLFIFYTVANVPFKYYKEMKKEKLTMQQDYFPYYYHSERVDTRECIICLEEFVRNDLICVGKCNIRHITHEHCLISWLENHSVCPICKRSIHLH